MNDQAPNPMVTKMANSRVLAADICPKTSTFTPTNSANEIAIQATPSTVRR